MTSSRFTKRLLSHVGHKSYEPSDLPRLMGDLRIAPEDRTDFAKAVAELAEAGQVVWGDGDVVLLPPMGNEIIGRFRKNQRGFGFVIPREANQHGDLFIPAFATGDAMDGDLVRAVVKRSNRPEPGKSPFVGEVVEVVERGRNVYAGTLGKRGGQWLVFPDGKVLTTPIVVRDAESKNGKDGDKVAFELTHYPEGDLLGEGVILRVLGDAGRPDVETLAVMQAYNLPEEFPDACVAEARALTLDFEEELRTSDATGFDDTVRTDIRNDYIITIDPPDAKDYDDAISLQRIDRIAGGGSGWRLGVHIADVSHFVTLGTALDAEARERANSVYLPRLVIPMLPEVLSNGICSLQEGVPRFCKSAYIDYDDDGRVRAKGFAATIIKSAKRLTYLEAQALIDGDEEEAKRHAKTEPNYTQKLKDTLRDMNTLSRAIRDRRKKQGMIHLDLPDVELVFNESGHVVDAHPEDNAYTHTLIEMFMVEANEAVARLFEELGVPLLRRIHPEPAPGDFDQLREFVKVAGYKIPKSPTREELQALLDATAGKPSAPAVHFAVLRTLTRAEYSPALIGHFALASEAYAHFTSPIRRYPDLTVHRALTQYLEMTDNGTRPPRADGEKSVLGKRLRDTDACPDEGELTQIGGRCNVMEEAATGAERELRQFLVLQLLAEHIGEVFDGLVTGVTGAGVFIRLDKYLAEGIIRTEDLPSFDASGRAGGFGRSRWQLDKRTGALVEQNSGRSFSIGDRVAITVLQVDLARRQMQLGVAQASSREAGKAKDPGAKLAGALRLGDVIEEDRRNQKTGADKRAQRSKSRDQGKRDYRPDRKDKGK
jgi:ribonuclease R